jgi:hypothetical protein
MAGLVAVAIALASAIQWAARSIDWRPWPWATGLAIGVAALVVFWGIGAKWATDIQARLGSSSAPGVVLLLGIGLTFGVYGYAIAYFKEREPAGPPGLSLDGMQTRYVSATYVVSSCDAPVVASVGVWPGGAARRDGGMVRVVEGTHQTDLEPATPTGDGLRWLLPDPVEGLHTARAVEAFEGYPLRLQRLGDRLEGEVPERTTRGILHFEADWLERRDETSCVLALPRIAGEQHVWTAVQAGGEVELLDGESAPDPLVDRNGVSLWECERARPNAGVPGQCSAQAVFAERDEDFERNLNLILIGAGLSLGLALLVEGALALAGAGPRGGSSGAA